MIDENGNKLSSEDVADILLKLVEDFQKEYPLFLGLKVILAIPRNSDEEQLEQKMQRFMFVNLLMGFQHVTYQCT